MSKPPSWPQNALIALIAVPVLGILMGGIYSLPAMHMTKSRDPGYTALLATGLSTTAFGLGLLVQLPFPVIVTIWVLAIIALLVRRYFGPLDHNMERFGIIHAFTLAAMFWSSIY